ncbi:MAG: DNA primase [Candidatus Omnitrophota bacterium]
MTKLYSDAVVSEVLDRSNIVELIASYLPLKRAGRNYKTTCPFHPEKTPSFIISADKQIFHCFGCGVGGNALTFIMQYEKLNFREALETLSQRSGIPLPEPARTEFEKTKHDLAKDLFVVYEKTCSFYHGNLLTGTPAQSARGYLQRRGLSKETAQKFQLGYAPEGWEALIGHLRSKGIPLSLIEKSGLVVLKEQGGYYDRFRNRIIFPIVDVKNRVVGFGARVLDESLPKYINSPETPIYTKGKHLFGLNLAKDAIRSQDAVIVVEGYLDMMTPFEAGIHHIVASLGTALTLDQIRLIKRFTGHVVMLYDADLAGQLATLRALELLIQEDMDVRIASLPDNEDPDSYVRRVGKEEFLKCIASAKPIFDYKLNYLFSKYDVTTVTGKDRLVREILPTIKKFQSHTLRSEYIKRTAQSIGLNEEALWEDFKSIESGQTAGEEPENAAVEHYQLTQIPITERMLVKLMLDEMHLLDTIRTMVDPSDFMDEKLKKIVQFIFDFFGQHKECRPAILINHLGDNEAINTISELATLEIHNCPNKEKILADCVRRLKRDKILHRCLELHRQIQDAQDLGHQDRLTHLLSEYNALLKQRSTVHGEACR